MQLRYIYDTTSVDDREPAFYYDNFVTMDQRVNKYYVVIFRNDNYIHRRLIIVYLSKKWKSRISTTKLN